MQNPKPDTLVCTATLGNRNTLCRTINSVKEIGGSRIKHIITAPKEQLENLRKFYPDMEITPEPEKTKGIYSALNKVINAYAKDFKYVTYINDDDYWLPDFTKLFEIMDKKSDIDGVYGRTVFFSDSNKLLKIGTSSPRYFAYKTLFTQKIILFTQQATLIRSELFYKLNGFDENYKLVSDTKFWIQAIDIRAKFYYVNAECAAYTIQEKQLSADKITQNFEHHKLLQEKMFLTKKGCSFFEVLFFRIYNINVYLKNFLINLSQ